MFVLGLFTCVMLRAFSAQAKVVDSFTECNGFFYQGIEPSGMDQNAKKICQMLENKGFFYATLYSVHHKIPLYSAYILDPACSSNTARKDIWHLEPQLSQATSPIFHMVRETRDTQNLYKGNQAISSDYSFTRYDRGHLNPSCFQCSDGRKATFTLTNAAPMNEQFNRKHWWNWEKMLRQYLIQQLATDLFLATAFIVTGTVPDPNVRIPHRGSSEDPERVTVPSHIWTAVCYKHTDDTKSFSFGYIGRNRQEDSDIRMMSIPELNRELFEHFETHHPIKIFVDDCFGVNKKLVDVQNMFQKLINLPVKQEVQMSLETQKRKISSDIIPEKKGKMNEMTGKMAFESMSNYYDVAEVLKIFVESACLITYAKPRIFVHDELRKREVSTGPDAIQCLLVSENQKTAADGSLCSSISESDYSCQCNTGGETKPCCSTPCLYMDKLNSYRCYSEKKLIVCSPPYSLITYKGQKCLDNYPCATYGKDYYWCWTAYNPYFLDFEWDYCSPPLWSSKAKNGKYCRNNHACAKYGYRYMWCYTDDEDNWDYC